MNFTLIQNTYILFNLRISLATYHLDTYILTSKKCLIPKSDWPGPLVRERKQKISFIFNYMKHNTSMYIS